MVNPLLVRIIGRGVWIAVGAGLGYLVAKKQEEPETAPGILTQIEPGHVAFVVKGYEVTQVLQPGAEVAAEDLPGIVNVRFTGHLPQVIAIEVQELLAKGKIGLGKIGTSFDPEIKSRTTEALKVKDISTARRIIAESYGTISAEQTFRAEDFIERICFWVWLIDSCKDLHYSPAEMEQLGIQR